MYTADRSAGGRFAPAPARWPGSTATTSGSSTWWDSAGAKAMVSLSSRTGKAVERGAVRFSGGRSAHNPGKTDLSPANPRPGRAFRLKPAHERREFVPGALDNPKCVVDEADQAVGMSGQEHHEEKDDKSADGPAHGSASLPAANKLEPAAARPSWLTAVAVALGSSSIQAM